MFSHFILALMKENVLFRFLGTQRTERTLRLVSTHGDKNSYLATLCKIIIWLNKVTTRGVRYRLVRSS